MGQVQAAPKHTEQVPSHMKRYGQFLVLMLKPSGESLSTPLCWEG